MAGPIAVPRVRWHGAWSDRLVLATEAIPLAARTRDVSLEHALDAATILSSGAATVGPVVHGDLSPWNLLRTAQGLALVDWEEGRIEREPLFDLAHFVVSTCALVRRDNPGRALKLLTGPGSLGWRHLTALGQDPLSAPALLKIYLEATWAHTESSWEYRRAVLHLLEPMLAGVPDHSASLAIAGVRAESVGETPP
jgi:aminoglycoside phosphotransferase (APT) family kinase protein